MPRPLSRCPALGCHLGVSVEGLSLYCPHRCPSQPHCRSSQQRVSFNITLCCSIEDAAQLSGGVALGCCHLDVSVEGCSSCCPSRSPSDSNHCSCQAVCTADCKAGLHIVIHLMQQCVFWCARDVKLYPPCRPSLLGVPVILPFAAPLKLLEGIHRHPCSCSWLLDVLPGGSLVYCP